jgi:hypothetical protein
MTESQRNRIIAAELIAKATRDEAFRKQFVADPKAAFIAAGADIDAAVAIAVLENTETLRHIVLPPLALSAPDLSDAQLAALAGGGAPASISTQFAPITIVLDGGIVLTTIFDLTAAQVNTGGVVNVA